MSRLWAVDLRSLGLLRISYGVLLLLDLLIRSVDLVTFYTDYGACPRAAVLELGWAPGYVSVHMANGTWPFQAALFLIAGAACVALTLGWHTRLAAFVCWAHLISLHSRNGMVLDGGDIYLRVVLFWGLFLPWGARFSLDALRQPDRVPQENRWFDAASFCYLIQICFVYWFAAIHKTSPEWRKDGTAVYYAMMIEQLTTPLAALLLKFPHVMKMLTFFTLAWEGLGPFFLLGTGPLRFLGVAGIAMMHLSFGIFMHLAIFAWIGALSPIGLLPTWFWESRVGRWIEVRCERLTAWVAGRCQRLPGGGSIPAPADPALSGILLGLLLYCLWWNLSTVVALKKRIYCPPLLGQFLRIDQQWNMFSPKPLVEDGWYVIEGEQLDGQKLDLFNGGKPLSWDKPADVAATYANARWRKFMMNLWSSDLQAWRLHYGRYLCRWWNDHREGADQIKEFKIVFNRENTLLTGTDKVKPVTIWHHYCFAMPSPSPSPSPTPATPGGVSVGPK